MCTPISSAASEREFKGARDLANGSRSRLLPKNVRRLLFLKHNIPAVNYGTFALASKPVIRDGDQSDDKSTTDEDESDDEDSDD